jgi:hypothetical protein
MLADRYGTGRVLAAGGLLYALGNAVMALGEACRGIRVGGGRQFCDARARRFPGEAPDEREGNPEGGELR